jgi:O-antigen/teichoic acid export membrane protein
MPLLTRLYAQDVYGAWLQLLLMRDILLPLLCLRLETALLRYLTKEKDPQLFIKGVFTITFLIVLLFLGFTFFSHGLAADLFFGDRLFKNVLFMGCIWIAVNGLMHVGLSVLRAMEKITILSLRELLSALCTVVSAVCAFFFGLEIHNFILLCIVGDTLLLLWTLVQIGVPFPFTSLRNTLIVLKKFIPYSAPLILNSIFLWFTQSLDRLLIVNLIGLSAVGIYGVSLQVANILSVVLNPINFVLFPRVIASWNMGNKEDVNKFFSKALTLTLIFSIPVLIGLFVVSDGLIQLLAGRNYAAGSVLVLFFLFSVLASMIYQNHLYVIHLVEKTYLLPFLFIFTASMNLILGYFLTKAFGLTGAVIARFCTLFFMAAAVTCWSHKFIQFKLPWMLILKVLIISVIMGACVFLMPMNSWSQIMIVVVAGCLICAILFFFTGVVTKKTILSLKREFL